MYVILFYFLKYVNLFGILNLLFIIWINLYIYLKDVLFFFVCFLGNLLEVDVKCWFFVSVIYTHVFNRNIEFG